MTKNMFMKKFILSAIVLLTGVSAFAQAPRQPRTVSLIPRTGLNFSTATKNKGEAGKSFRLGFVLGADLQYQLNGVLGVSGGLFYSQQGFNDDFGKAAVNYLNIPVLLNLYVTDGFAVKMGVQPSVKLTGKYKANEGRTTVNGDKITNEDKNLKIFDFSIPVGLSYETGNIVLDARYNAGLVNLIGSTTHKNSVIQLTVGYRFGVNNQRH